MNNITIAIVLILMAAAVSCFLYKQKNGLIEGIGGGGGGGGHGGGGGGGFGGGGHGGGGGSHAGGHGGGGGWHGGGRGRRPWGGGGGFVGGYGYGYGPYPWYYDWPVYVYGPDYLDIDLSNTCAESCEGIFNACNKVKGADRTVCLKKFQDCIRANCE